MQHLYKWWCCISMIYSSIESFHFTRFLDQRLIRGVGCFPVYKINNYTLWLGRPCRATYITCFTVTRFASSEKERDVYISVEWILMILYASIRLSSISIVKTKIISKMHNLGQFLFKDWHWLNIDLRRDCFPIPCLSGWRFTNHSNLSANISLGQDLTECHYVSRIWTWSSWYQGTYRRPCTQRCWVVGRRRADIKTLS